MVDMKGNDGNGNGAEEEWKLHEDAGPPPASSRRRSSSWRHVYLRERFRNLVLVTLYLQNK